MHEEILAPSAAAHVNQLFTEYGAIFGIAVACLGALCLIIGVLDTRYFRRLIGSVFFVLASTVICGSALYFKLGSIRASSDSLADYGFLAAHVIVIGTVTTLVSTPFLCIMRVQRMDARRRAFVWWLSRFGWGYFTVFIAAPAVGAAVEYLLATHPDMRWAPRGSGLLITGEVFGSLLGWLIIGPAVGLLNVLRVPMQRWLDSLAGKRLTGAGVAFAVGGLSLMSFILSLSHLHSAALVLR